MKFYDKLKVRCDQADSLRIGASKCAWLWDRTAAIADIMRGRDPDRRHASQKQRGLRNKEKSMVRNIVKRRVVMFFAAAAVAVCAALGLAMLSMGGYHCSGGGIA